MCSATLRFLPCWAHLLYIRSICIQIECRKKSRFQWAIYGFKVRPPTQESQAFLIFKIWESALRSLVVEVVSSLCKQWDLLQACIKFYQGPALVLI